MEIFEKLFDLTFTLLRNEKFHSPDVIHSESVNYATNLELIYYAFAVLKTRSSHFQPDCVPMEAFYPSFYIRIKKMIIVKKSLLQTYTQHRDEFEYG